MFPPPAYSMPPCVQDIGHGIQLCRFPGEIESKTFGCYLDAKGKFHAGYIYRNGSNYRVVCWEDGQRTNRTVPRRGPVFRFSVVTPRPFRSADFTARNFEFPWFCPTTQVNLQNELMALQKMEMDNLANRIGRLSVK